MDRFARATAIAAAMVGAFACLPASADDATVQAVAASTPTVPGPPAQAATDPGAEVVFRALSLLGVNYRFGGNTADTGLDCSGLVRLVFHDTLGLPLPRRSEEISRVGGNVAPAELQPGDLVFFNTLRRAFSHVGIYIGNNQFVHAPSTGGSIRVESLGADYWSRRFDGARRVLAADLAGATAFTGLTLGTSPAAGSTLALDAPSRRPASTIRDAAPVQAAARPSPRDAGRRAAPPARAIRASAPVAYRADARPAERTVPAQARAAIFVN